MITCWFILVSAGMALAGGLVYHSSHLAGDTSWPTWSFWWRWL